MKLKSKGIKVIASPYFYIDGESRTKFRFRELLGNIALGNFELTFGKSLVKFGTGYMFTPIGVITPPKELSDPEDELRTQEGVKLIKLDYYRENLNISATVFERETWNNVALFGFTHFQGFDLYGVLYYPEYRKLELGLAFSKTIGESVELHGEWMLHRRSPVKFHRVYDAEDPKISYSEWPLFQPKDKGYHELLVGTNVTVKGINLIAEFYHRDWGLKKVEWENLKSHFQYNFEISSVPIQSQDIQADLSVLDENRRGIGRDYLFFRIWKTFQNTGVSTVGFLNCQDGSAVLILDLEHQPCSGIYLFFRPVFFTGKKWSEYGGQFYSNIFQLGFRIAF